MHAGSGWFLATPSGAEWFVLFFVYLVFSPPRRLAAATVFTPPRHASPAWVLSPTSNDVSIAARGYQPARATARGQANRAARVMLALPERQPAPSPPFWAAGRCWPSPAARAILSMVRHTHVARHSAALLCRRRYALLEGPPPHVDHPLPSCQRGVLQRRSERAILRALGGDLSLGLRGQQPCRCARRRRQPPSGWPAYIVAATPHRGCKNLEQNGNAGGVP